MVKNRFSWAPLLRDRRGVTALEYGLIAAAVVTVGLSAFSLIGDSVGSIFNNVQTTLAEPSAPESNG